jgi:hypothetical protein
MDRNEGIIKPIPGVPGYGVTQDGRVFSERPINGKGPFGHKWRPIKVNPGGTSPYLQFGVDKRKMLVHKAVALAFIGPRPIGLEIAHVNGNCQDNRADNIRYVTHSQNEKMKREHGTSPCGEANPQAKLRLQQVEVIRQSYSGRGSGVLLARKYGVSEATVSVIIHHKRWRDEEDQGAR